MLPRPTVPRPTDRLPGLSRSLKLNNLHFQLSCRPVVTCDPRRRISFVRATDRSDRDRTGRDGRDSDGQGDRATGRRKTLLGLPLCLQVKASAQPASKMGQFLSTSVSESIAKGSESRASQDDCVFCQIAKEGPLSTTVLYQDERIMAFPDRSPAAAAHILVIPREHIAHGYCLHSTEEDRQLVSHMVTVGKSLLDSKHGKGSEQKFGFHMPPLNSVNHLHLHCFSLPHEPAWKAVKYADVTAWGRSPVVVGFISAENMLIRLGGQLSPVQSASGGAEV